MNSVLIKSVEQLIVVTVLSFLFAFSAYAQSGTTVLNISITPGEPRARESVVATLDSFSINLNAARISWFLDGKLAQEGIGRKTFSFRVGTLGSQTSVRVVVSGSNTQIERSFNIRPAEVDIIWEALTYTPPLYKGKALVSSNSKVKISAIPHFISNGRRISSENLIYTWSQDRTVLGSLSGVGKNSIIIDAPRLLEEARVTVSVSSADSGLAARNETLITAEVPLIIFYEKHPTEGIKYNNAIGPEFNLSQEEITLRAEPFFFSTEDLASRRVNFSWSLNNAPADSSGKINEITLRRESGGGVARLALEIENISKILQQAAANLLIKF